MDDTDIEDRKREITESLDSEKEVQMEDGKDSEVTALLPPKKDGMTRKSDKVRRSVQWNDKDGNQLAEILEFQASDVSDSDDEDSDSCTCNIM